MGPDVSHYFWLPLITLLFIIPTHGDPRSPYTALRPPRNNYLSNQYDLTTSRPFVGPNVCRSRNRTHCCPGWTARPNTLLCVTPVCSRNCGGPGTCIAPNLCRCVGGVEAPSCGPTSMRLYDGYSNGGCRRICMNGGTCNNGTCSCAPGWQGEYCTDPICREPCLHGGRCIAPDRCVCFHGLSGKRCEIDRRTGPCYQDIRGSLCTNALQGVVCTKQLCCATVGKAWGHPCEHCGELDCEHGFLRNFNTHECLDIDECAAVPGLCEGGRCVNTIGSFNCECPPGQIRDPVTNACTDEDECQSENICENGRCVNTDGSYYCLCNPHFIPSPDKKYCIDGRVGNCFAYLSDSGECQDRLTHQLSNRDCCCGQNMGVAWGDYCTPCPQRHELEYSRLCGGGNGGRKYLYGNGNGGPGPDSYRNETYELEPPSPIFEVNECMLRQDICGLGTCLDKPAGYECSCQDGAELVQPDGNPTCIDIDECALGLCRGGRCENTPGSFRCVCPEGFDVSADGRRCVDTNECSISGMCANGNCVNVDGSFRCECKSGFKLSPTGRACVDVDECRENARICLFGQCENVPGSYKCHCNAGFRLSEAGACGDIDECAERGTCAHGRCFNTEGSFRCLCDAGFELTPDRATCRDVDECRTLPNICQNGRCINTPGSFKCDCRSGFNLSPDGRSCIDDMKDLCYIQVSDGRCENPSGVAVTRSACCCTAVGSETLAWGKLCATCPKHGTSEFSSLCPEGVGRDNSGRDVNECTQRPNGVCANGACENLEPGYKCMCDIGYHPDSTGTKCIDTNECEMQQSLCRGGTCRNTPGSFVCVCPPGTQYESDTQICQDIDECTELNNPCENGRCINVHGSYECECAPGFVLDKSARNCLDNRRGSCWTRVLDGQCEAATKKPMLRQECCCGLGLAWGSPCEACEPQHCPCPKGYAKLDGSTCRDIDECEVWPSLCGGGGSCLNTDGSYRCACPPGLTLDDTNTNCIDERKEACYVEYSKGICSRALEGNYGKALCCCSAVGRAWGSNRCESCPAPGTSAHAELCGLTNGGGALVPGSRDDNRNPKDSYWDPVEGIWKPGDDQWKPGNGKWSPEDGKWSPENGKWSPEDGKWSPENGKWSPEDGKWSPEHGKWSPEDGRWSSGDKKWSPGDEERGDIPFYGRPNVGGPFGQGSWNPNMTGIMGSGLQPGMEQVGPVDINECLEFRGVCLNGRCQNTPGSFVCKCNQGYGLDDTKMQCVDVNECTIVSGVCGAGECVNTEGSFTCHCLPGYRTNDMMKICQDIDECAESPGMCRGGTCVNIPGSFRCECARGLELAPDGLTCKDIDECSRTSGICSNGICENLMGTYQCVCSDGYTHTDVASHCEDIDECEEDNGGCDHNCENTPGSRICSCEPGYKLRGDGTTCVDIDECSLGTRVCGGGECKNTVGSYVCTCGEGLLPAPDKPGCLDVDECLTQPDICGAGSCINTVGSFTCKCHDGYSVKPEEGAACTDDDECALETCNCHPAAECINIPGSFECRCRDGWTGDGLECSDVDECATNNGGCHPHASCHNTDGSYTCVCDPGFKGNGESCVDIDECANDPTLCENGHCENAPGGYACTCDMGFVPSDDNKACVDIDECRMFTNVCVFGRCENTFGMFRCICDPGYQPDRLADNLPGGNCTDIDECLSPQSCLYGECVNTQGSYECNCPPNFELVADGNACYDERRGACYTNVEVREGRELCYDDLGEEITMSGCCCTVGLAWGRNCERCPEPDSPEYAQLCPGGPGYQPVLEQITETVEPNYVVTLADVDECADMPGICENGQCTNIFGSYICSCLEGFRLAGSGLRCDDIDECQEVPGICGQGLCRNLPGSYVCLCPEGYVPMPNGKECVDMRQRSCYMEYTNEECSAAMTSPQTKMVCCCSMGKAWGDPCEPCPDENSPEFKILCNGPGEINNPLTNRSEQIDECQLMNLCGHGVCIDTPGSFECHCDRGYIYDSSSHQCRDEDECSRTPSPCLGIAHCVNIPGSFECRCPSGYKHSPSLLDCIDIDECVEIPGVCAHGGTCRNTIGSFSCQCAPGYALHENECRDVDECSRQRNICRNGTCVNLPGSYECTCNEGFKLSTNNDCIDINECRESDVTPCRNGRCRNTLGSFRCECSAGYELAPDGRNCRDIDECTELPEPCGTEGEPLCTNTAGGYECSCASGYRSINHRCFDRDECRDLPSTCAGGECVNIPGGVLCNCPSGWVFDNVTGSCIDKRKDLCYDKYERGRCHLARGRPLSRSECCCSSAAAWGVHCEVCPRPGTVDFTQVCPGGMGRPDPTQDLDECTVRPGLCRGGACVNTDGSFRCACPPGFILDPSGLECIDEDECQTSPSRCGNGTCTNTIGSFTCECRPGFTPGPAQTCVDVDECVELGGACAFRCHNTPGSYRCVCPYGYQLAPDGIHCQDVNECNTPANDCKHECKNLVGSYACLCPEGFRQTHEGCEDIDECAADKNLCTSGTCINTDGAYTCDCDAGYELSPDGKDCLDRRTGNCWRQLTAGRCIPVPWGNNNHGGSMTHHITKAGCCCTMGAAWGPECELCPKLGTDAYHSLCAGKGYDALGHDVDECQAMPDLCEGGRCLNTLGSFRCVCPRGYKASGDKCSDIDECLEKPCSHICKNTKGSYECKCRPGYTLSDDGVSCEDEDECKLGTHTCQQECKNIVGSYECSCKEGYETKGDACVDINECTAGDVCPSPAKCVNLMGSYRCVCPKGYRLDDSGNFCVDRDECSESSCDGICRNYRGGYKCECGPGSVKSASGCVSNDVCHRALCGAEPCFPAGASYRCGCPVGYEYSVSRDVCLQAAGPCVNADCFFGCSAMGSSYRCGCPPGYREVGPGHCLTSEDIGDVPVFPLTGSEYRVPGNEDLISTEGCFSCQMNGRHRRDEPDEGVMFANGTTVVRRRRRKHPKRRIKRALPDYVELAVPSKRAKRGVTLLRLVPTSPSSPYKITYDEDKAFSLHRSNGAVELRPKRRLSPLRGRRQVEIETRPTRSAPPLKLYVTIDVTP